MLSCLFLKFSRYNCLQRCWPPEDYKELHDRGITYTTTICVLISAVINVAKQAKIDNIKELFRGVAMSSNPKPLFAPFKYFPTERCLISTTKDQELAIQFSGLWKSGFRNQYRRWPTVYEINVEAVDLGADISSFSQYPGATPYIFLLIQ
jgi:hypothetical protein